MRKIYCRHLRAGAYDFIFMDAAKGQYINFLPELKRLAADGAVVLTDNVLQDGDVIESRYAVERRNRTIHTQDEGISVRFDT
jgi:predicted O-methyltransferase YrrM